MKNLSKTKKLLSLGGVFVIIVIASAIYYFGLVLDVGTHSSYFVSRDFNQAFTARQTGNCDEFQSHVYRDTEKWYQRCLSERNNSGDSRPIENFTIDKVTVTNHQAFLLVKLKRSGNNEEYSVNYHMDRKTINPNSFLLPKTIWVLTQTLN